MVVSILLFLKREVALAALAKFAAFTTFTELRSVRMLDRKFMGKRYSNHIELQIIAFVEKKCSSLF